MFKKIIIVIEAFTRTGSAGVGHVTIMTVPAWSNRCAEVILRDIEASLATKHLERRGQLMVLVTLAQRLIDVTRKQRQQAVLNPGVPGPPE